jgi:hypothetical protein
MTTNEKLATDLFKKLSRALSEGRTYFVFNKYAEMVAGPIGKDGANIRTFHDRELYYVNAKDMEEMVKFMGGETEDANKNYCTASVYTD